MGIIALLTDFGTSDGFVGSVKGVIKSINKNADIIDISHDITPFDILEASIVLNASYRYFPEKTIFVCVVDPGVGTERKPIAVETEKYIFIAPDNGLLTLPLKNEKIKSIVEISNKKYILERETETFHGRDIFAPAAAYLSKGVEIHQLGKKLNQIKKLNIPQPLKTDKEIVGQIIKFDRFGNGITNLTDIPENPKEITVNGYKIQKVCKAFLEGEKDKLNLIKGSFGFYELFVPMDSAKDRFNLKTGEKVIVKLLE